jgi:hypothetical protein
MCWGFVGGIKESRHYFVATISYTLQGSAQNDGINVYPLANKLFCGVSSSLKIVLEACFVIENENESLTHELRTCSPTEINLFVI